MSDNDIQEEGDPSVPSDLLELHVALEDAGVTPQQFKAIFES